MKRRVMMMLAAAVLLLTVTGCDGNGTGTGNSGNNPPISYEDTHGYLKDDSVYVVGIEKLPHKEEEIYQQLFDIDNFVEIKIDISDENLMQIQKDYEHYRDMGSKSPIYREASVNIKIDSSTSTVTYHIPNVGIRMKGNTSRRDFYNEEEGQHSLIHYKMKFMDGEFATLDGLEMRWNKGDDGTYIREYYAYEMYRDMGILAPRMMLASLDVADLHQGVFTISEPVDKNFIKRNVAEEDQGGDLYKCGWTWQGATLTKDCSYGVEDEEKAEFYNYDLKTNKKTSEHTELKKLIQTLNKRNVTKQEIAEVVDMENFLRFAAISYFVGSPDDIRYNYNNHYIYFLKSSGKAIFIPYDCDRVFGMTKDWNPTGDGMASICPYSNMAAGAGQEQRNPLFRYTVDKGGYYLEEYALQLKIVAASGWLDTDRFEQYYQSAKANYAGCTTPGKRFHNAWDHDFSFDINRSSGLNTGDGNASFAEYIDAKLESYRNHINHYK